MHRTLLVIALFGCGPPRPAGIQAPEHAAADPVALPCGARTVEELDPFGKTAIGTCVVEMSGSTYVLSEDGVPLVSAAEAKPLRALDPRIPGPAGVRVGMTGLDIRATAAGYEWIDCTAFGDMIQCRLRRAAVLAECGEGDPDDMIAVELVRPPEVTDGDTVEGSAAWAILDAHPLTAVVLSMPC